MEASATYGLMDPARTEILQALARGATVLTPTARAARQLAAVADGAALQEGQQTWRAATILPWTAWTRALWGAAIFQGAETRVLLNEIQERAIWHSVLRQFEDADPSGLASHVTLCMSAYRLFGTFALDTFRSHSLLSQASTAETRFFRKCCQHFEQFCSEGDYLPQARVETELAQLLQQQRIRVDTEYLLVGFSERTPSHLNLIQALRSAEVTVWESTISSGPQAPPLLQHYATRHAELQACAQWLRSELQRGVTRTIAVVVPDLTDTREDLERVFRTALAPGRSDVLHTTPEPYEFSEGRPIHSLPLVKDALLLLRWCAGRVSLDEAGALLCSRHLMLTSSAEAGAADEATLREWPSLRKTLSIQQAALFLSASPTGRRLFDLEHEVQRTYAARESFATFAERAQVLLRKAGWPGAQALLDEELQGVEQWQALLDDVASLDVLGRPTQWTAFLDQLQLHCATTTFRPEHRAAPIQVMTVSAALGSTADSLWFLHAEASVWPQRSAPAPLLPLSLQRTLGTPGTDSKRDEDTATASLRHLICSTAGETRLSWSAENMDEAGMPSPIAEQVVCAFGGSSERSTPMPGTTFLEQQVETFLDTTALPSLPLGEAYGGVSVLTAQAQCGFRAWAEKRLFADPLETVDDGLSAQERGNQVHTILEKFWKHTLSQAALRRSRLAVGEDGWSERDRLLTTCIEDVCQTASATGWDAAYMAVQQQRLFRLLAAWLDYEEQRPPFQVLQVERRVRDVAVGPLRLSMRVDRIDQIVPESASGGAEPGIVLIDYKTGSSSRNNWLGERPDRPQLPTYAFAAATAAGAERVDGIAFASIRAGAANLHLDGFAEAGLLPTNKRGRQADFLELKHEWQRNVEALAHAFAAGDAAVDPKVYPKTCETCSQRVLCRLDVHTLLQAEADEADPHGLEVDA